MQAPTTVLERLGRPLQRQDDPAAIIRRLDAIMERHGEPIAVRLWNGETVGPPDAGYRLVLHHPWSLRAMLVPPTDLTVGEAFIFDAIDVEGSMVEAFHAWRRLAHRLAGHPIVRARVAREVLSLPRPPERNGHQRARLRGFVHSKSRDAQAVRRHYDVGNDFYRLFLDERLVYSCAYFTDDDPADPADDPEALDRAQVRKLDLVCRKLRLHEGARLLDIGCGWGSLVLHAATHYGARATGITLSHEQAALAREQVERAGLSDRVEIRVEDYRDTTGTFDAVASVGMFEHVGKERFALYFSRMHALTAPGGRFLNHAITTGGRDVIRAHSPGSTFLGSYVFPDGTLGPAHVAVRHMERAGFELVDVHQLRRHYARTLRHWLHNLTRNAEAVRATAGETIYRIWRAYMAGAAVGFDTNDLGVVQVLGVKGASGLPLGRSWMEPTIP